MPTRTTEHGDESSQSLSRLVSAVSNDSRRTVLRQLHDTDGGTVEVDELTDEVVERLDGGDRPTDDSRRRVRLALRHIHLPKLAFHGLIRHDTETGQVQDATGEMSEELSVLLKLYEADE